MRNEARAALRVTEGYDIESVEQNYPLEEETSEENEERNFKFKSIFTKDGVSKIFSKAGIRTLVIIAAVVVIGVAVYLNWNLLVPVNNQPESGVKTDTPTENNAKDDTAAYFASAQLSRQNAREESIGILQSIIDSESSDETAKAAALENITKISNTVAAEANIENLIKSKGFADCIAVISGENANIIVKSDGLLANELAQIMEIVYLQANILPKNVRISEYS